MDTGFGRSRKARYGKRMSMIGDAQSAAAGQALLIVAQAVHRDRVIRVFLE